MELTAPRSKSLFVDGLCWTGAMLVLAGIAFFLLSREQDMSPLAEQYQVMCTVKTVTVKETSVIG